MPNIQQAPRSAASAIAAAVVAALGLGSSVALAADDPEIQALKEQIKQLQKHVDDIEARQRAAAAAPAAVATPVVQAAPAAATGAPATGDSNSPSFYAGPVKVTLNGFVELMVINRNRNESADWASNFNASIPFANSHNYDLSEFHFSERQSRVAALVEGPSSGHIGTEAYLETDFGGATNATPNESNSFAPRVRHFYADYRDIDNGWYLLFGQTWSLLTGNKVGITLRQENIPLTIDGQYLVGFDWLRLPQVRVVKTFGDTLAVGLSAENPAAIISSNSTTGAPAVNSFFNNPGVASAFVTTNNITTDPYPDVVLKFALDPGWGHYELFGVNRWFRSRFTTAGEQTNRTTTGTGFGGNLILPVVPKMLDFQASALAGHGIGRYGSAQLPDATVSPIDGSLGTLNAYQAMTGLIFRPTPTWTLFAYGGIEHVSSRYYDVRTTGATPQTFGYGYGNPLFSNAGCDVEGSAVCASNTSSVSDIDVGAWWKFYQGKLGNMQFGGTWNYIKRDVFSGIGGDPSTNINIVMLSYRYYPYQR